MDRTGHARRGSRPRLLAIIGPGLLVAATGVGAGDLYSAGFAGQSLGLAVLWAVVVGAALKLVLTEGLARWQLATGSTLLEGCQRHIGRPFQLLFGAYLVLWSFFVSGALMSACGVTLNALWPLFEDQVQAKLVFGSLSSLLGVGLALAGGFRLFERAMAALIGVMFGCVAYTALALRPDPLEVASGLLLPRIPPGGVGWTLALMGGVGGTLTVLCYGYWIREQGREGPGELATTRLDLTAGYAVTGLFGLAMVVIGSQVAGEGRGAGFIVSVAAALEQPLGAVASRLFLLGALAAVLSSLIGVWQSVPYVFADFVRLARGHDTPPSTRDPAYRLWLGVLALAPLVSVQFPFKAVQKFYAVFGALFMPLLAAALLLLLGRPRLVPAALANRWWINLLLVGALALFAWLGLDQLLESYAR